MVQGKAVTLTRLAVDPAWTFFRAYVLQRGFLDGRQGLAIAWMAALYTFLKYAKASVPLVVSATGAFSSASKKPAAKETASGTDENPPSR
jgi:hypothetical protein